MRKKYAVSFIMAAFLSLMGASGVSAADEIITFEASVGDMVYTFPDQKVGTDSFSGLFQGMENVDPGTGQALKDACRCKGSTKLINGKLQINSSRALGVTVYARVTFRILSDGLPIVTSVPQTQDFDLPGDQLQQIQNYSYSAKDIDPGSDLSLNEQGGVYGLEATLMLYKDQARTIPYGGGPWTDTENISINIAKLIAPKSIVCPGPPLNSLKYTLVRAKIGTKAVCDFSSGAIKIYDADRNLKKTISLDPLVFGTETKKDWDGNDEDGNCLTGLVYMELEMGKQLYVDNWVPVELVQVETSSAAMGSTSGSGVILYQMEMAIPDTGSGINQATVTPDLVSITINEIQVDGNGDPVLNNGEVVILDPGAPKIKKFDIAPATGSEPLKITLFREDTATDYYIFAAGHAYMLTTNVAVGGALDNAGNEWDVDPVTAGVQKNFRWFFKVDNNTVEPIYPIFIDPDGAGSNYSARSSW